MQAHRSHNTAYIRIATWYAHGLPSSPLHQTVVLAMLALIAALPIAACRLFLDIACGEGIFSRALAASIDAGDPVSITGIDLSLRQIETAREHEQTEPMGIWYIQDDMRQLATQHDADATVDLVTCCLGLTDVDDLTAVYHAVVRVLRPGGRLIYAISHPCGLCSTEDGQLQPGPYSYYQDSLWRSSNPRSVRFHVPNWHRPLSHYLSLALEAGFSLDACVEPEPAPEALCATPTYARVPYALILSLRSKGGRS